MTDDPEDSQLARLRQAIRRFATTEAGRYDTTRDRLHRLNDVIRDEFAEVLEPAINARAAASPHQTYEQKKTLAKWLNAELRSLGLAIRCPKTGKPCLIQAGTTRDARGRFRLDALDDTGRHTPSTSVALPELELMRDPQEHKIFRTRSR